MKNKKQNRKMASFRLAPDVLVFLRAHGVSQSKLIENAIRSQYIDQSKVMDGVEILGK